jgi:hypothetical protein
MFSSFCLRGADDSLTAGATRNLALSVTTGRGAIREASLSGQLFVYSYHMETETPRAIQPMEVVHAQHLLLG